MKAVIIGNHAAGLAAAETLRQGDRSGEIVVISKEDVPPYSRCLIGHLVSGHKQLDDILFKPRDFYRRNFIQPLLGIEVVRILPGEKKVLLSDGKKVGYDCLIIATGGSPAAAGIPGVNNQGVFNFHSLDDARRIIEYCKGVDTAVVLGGGLIGLKAAVALHECGKNAKIAVASPAILSQIVGAQEARIFESHLMEMGLEIFTNTTPSKILGKGKVEGIETVEGKKIACQMVVVAKGVTANKAIVKDSGVMTEHGILVDEHCRTSVPDIYAAGDVTQSQDSVRKETWVNAVWPLAVEEGRVAAENILGNAVALAGRTSMNALSICDLSLIACGLTGARDKVEGAETISVSSGKRDFKRFILKDNRLVGYVLVGNVAHAGVLTSLVKKGINIEKIKGQLTSGKYDFASVFGLIQENQEKFNEPEYQEVLAFL